MNKPLARLTAGTLLAAGALVAAAPVVGAEDNVAGAAQPSSPPPGGSGTGVVVRPTVDVDIARTPTGGIDLDVDGTVGTSASLAPGGALTGENTLLGGLGAFLRDLLGGR